MTIGGHYDYEMHRVALAPLLPGAGKAALQLATEQALALGEAKFGHFLQAQGLAPFWAARLHEHGLTDQFSQQLYADLHQARLQATGQYLAQSHALKALRRVLDNSNIPHLVFKGAHTRERYFPEPALRPAVDIDVLVPREARTDAIHAFITEGFDLHALPENISHECSLTRGHTSIDLHWDILRPGRTRIPMAGRFLASRRDYGDYWGPSDEVTLFLLLVHSVFTKYLTTPQASLVRQLDIACLLHTKGPDWREVTRWLAESGLKTAGWLSLKWFRQCTAIETTLNAEEALRPGKIRRGYLENWLDSNRTSRWLDTPMRVQLGFTLAAHDSLRDALRATQVARECRWRGEEEVGEIEAQLRQRERKISLTGSTQPR
ncbi:nucleotidyltransferase family protein [Haliea sp. E17]|uniref:nucleotidyltransferase family protein n=1 Tax=Haliea sp. E17 TaxID=3401576 RepID=UPI003AAED8B9